MTKNKTNPIIKKTAVREMYEDTMFHGKAKTWDYYLEKEQEQLKSLELSDEEIDEMVSKVSTKYMHQYYIDGLGEGARLYREQLKQRQ